MINSITLYIPNMCYGNKVKIDDLKRINLLYGINGAGKTLFSQFLAAYPDHKDGEFSECELTFSGSSSTILVYNEDFINKNFRKSSTIPGIFTLDQENAEALVKIEESQNNLDRVTAQAEGLRTKISKLNSTLEDKRSELAKKVWSIQEKHSDTVLKGMMSGFMGSKIRFLEKVLACDLSVNTENVSFDSLKAEYEELTSDNISQKDELSLLLFDIEEDRYEILLDQVIKGSIDSYLSDLVENLDHSDWISHGINHYIEDTDQCPFCARELSTELKNKIKRYLDQSFQNKIDELREARDKYIEISNIVKNYYRELEEIGYFPKLSNQILLLIEGVDSNISAFKDKIDEPSKKHSIIKLQEKKNEINENINQFNTDIKEFNKKLENISNTEAELERKFWKLSHDEFLLDIGTFKGYEDITNKEKDDLNNSLNDLESKGDSYKKNIETNLKRTKNIDSAIDKINNQLQYLGITNFKIIKFYQGGKPYYKITRDPQDQEGETYKTLSEGEKTLVTFLYFIELCCGQPDSKEVENISDKIIVIDDPISSLSFNFVFDISIFIKDIFLSRDSKFCQIFILTHHLYFFHELIPRKPKLPKDYSLFRITRSSNTHITKLDKDELKNNYELYWSIIREAKKNEQLKIVLPNAMRNVLEHYFSFIHGEEKLKDAIDGLSQKEDDPVFRSFHRYIDRFSHSDASNITDSSDVRIEQFMQYFEKIFKETGYQEHYNMMMQNTAMD